MATNWQGAREHLWLLDSQRGASIATLARRYGISEDYVRDGISRARRLLLERMAPPPRLVPLFPITSYTPHSVCPHNGPIREGSVFVCMVCHQSGQDGNAAMRRDGTDPEPDKSPETPSGTQGRRPRKDRRRSVSAGNGALKSGSCAGNPNVLVAKGRRKDRTTREGA